LAKHGYHRAVSGSRFPPYRTFLASDSAIRTILRDHRVIAAVGLPDDIVRALRQYGYRVIAVDGVAALKAVAEPVGIVCLGRSGEDAAAAVDGARALRAPVLWLAEGVVAPHEALRAHSLGMTVVMNRCLRREHEGHFGDGPEA
jgi:predicted CoA-binding protein